MNFREVAESDYPELATWFADIRKPYPIKEGVLPLVGVVGYDDHGLVCCCFLKQDGSSVARLEWIASSPKRSNEYRSESVKKLIKFMQVSIKKSNPQTQIVEMFTQSDFLISSSLALKFVPVRGFVRLLYVYDGEEVKQ